MMCTAEVSLHDCEHMPVRRMIVIVIPGDLVFQWFTHDLHSVPVLMLTTIIGGSRSLNLMSCFQFGVLHVSLLSGL
jgi:hypothetical protein